MSGSNGTTTESAAPLAHGTPVWLEIPATDVGRAKAFYETVFEWKFNPAPPGYTDENFAMFEHPDSRIGKMGVGGAITRVDQDKHTRGKHGVMVYLKVDTIENALEKIHHAGGKTVTEKEAEGQHGWMAHFADTEGNVQGIYCAVSS